MKDYSASTYGDHIAHVYDDWFRSPSNTDATVERLAQLAGTGPALELGVGTGRLALPLQARGVDVTGIDASEKMLEVLRSKPGGDKLRVSLGDLADVSVEGEFSLIFAAFNSFFALRTQEEQLRCFKNVACRLRPDGRFLVEAFVPDLNRFDGGQRVEATHVGLNGVLLDASRHDSVKQLVSTIHIVLTENGVRLYPVHLRYAWPSELDLMGKLAGLDLESRHGGYEGEPFDADSALHVTVWRRS